MWTLECCIQSLRLGFESNPRMAVDARVSFWFSPFTKKHNVVIGCVISSED